MSEKLTPKQRRFVEEYLIDLNGTQAAIRAGYSPKTANEQASRLLANVNIAAAVSAAKTEVSKRTEITQEWVLSTLKTVTDRCMQAEPVFDRKGNPVLVENAKGELAPAYVFNAAGATRATELLGKHIGMFGDNLKVTGELGLSGTVSIYLPDNGRDKA